MKNGFTFFEVNTEKIDKGILAFNPKKAFQYFDVPTKIINFFFRTSYALL